MNEVALNEGRKGLYVAFSLRDSFPNEWWQLQETGATSITIDEQHLPFVVRAHNPKLTSFTWAAHVQGAPANFAVTIGGTAISLARDTVMTTLCVATGGTAVLGDAVTISCNASKLDDLSVLVSYSIS